jgi:hypothetical protein
VIEFLLFTFGGPFPLLYFALSLLLDRYRWYLYASDRRRRMSAAAIAYALGSLVTFAFFGLPRHAMYM